MTRLDILARVLLGQTAFHRSEDAWDLLDEQRLVAAVLCPRQHHVSVAPLHKRVEPAPEGALLPYGAPKVGWKITDKPNAVKRGSGVEVISIEDGVKLVRRLSAAAR